MYLKNIDIKNYGAIESIAIETAFYENGSPKPLIITGHNGAGKTLLLTNIVDAMIEIKKTDRSNTEDEIEAYKAENKKYIRSGASEYIVKMRFEENDKTVDYIDVMSKNISASMKKEVIKELQSKEKFLETGCYKNTSQGSHQIQKQVLCYFPTDRYYNPAWFDKKESDKIYRDKRKMMDNRGASKIVKGNLLEQVESWILDVLLDKYLYEQVTETKEYYVKDHYIKDQGDVYAPKSVKEFTGYRGKNSTILSIINSLLSVIYTNKYENLEYARIGVSSKRDRSISIFIKKKEEKEFEIASDFSCLSSGEIMVLSLFVSILKEYDIINASRAFSVEQVEGIVVIDEVDQNLHIRFAKEILPILISTFPRIQFIITTHSPFFMLGMQDAMKEQFSYLSMPEGMVHTHLIGMDAIRGCYEVIIK
ncbi:MAG: AAA family ATPase [Cellulosilyticaceae bacterium]